MWYGKLQRSCTLTDVIWRFSLLSTIAHDEISYWITIVHYRTQLVMENAIILMDSTEQDQKMEEEPICSLKRCSSLPPSSQWIIATQYLQLYSFVCNCWWYYHRCSVVVKGRVSSPSRPLPCCSPPMVCWIVLAVLLHCTIHCLSANNYSRYCISFFLCYHMLPTTRATIMTFQPLKQAFKSDYSRTVHRKSERYASLKYVLDYTLVSMRLTILYGIYESNTWSW